MMFSLACRWSSLTHDLALSSDVCRGQLAQQLRKGKRGRKRETYGLRDVVDDDGAVGIAVIHGRERLVALLACCVPNLELDCRVLVERDGLCEEGSADGRFSVRVELVLGPLAGAGLAGCRVGAHLDEPQHDRALSHGGFTCARQQPFLRPRSAPGGSHQAAPA